MYIIIQSYNYFKFGIQNDLGSVASWYYFRYLQILSHIHS